MIRWPKNGISRLGTCRILAGIAGGLTIAAAIVVAKTASRVEDREYPIKYMAVAEVERLLLDILPSDGSVSVIADAANRQVLIRGPSGAQEVAAQLIQSVDHPPAPTRAQPVLRSYACQPATLETLVPRLRADFASDSEVRVSAAPAESRLFILADPRILAQIERQYGLATQSPPDVAVRNASLGWLTSEQFSLAMRDLFATRWRFLGQSADASRYELAAAMGRGHVIVDVDRAGNAIRMEGPPQVVAQLSRLVDSMAHRRPAQGNAERVVALRRADLASVRRAADAVRGVGSGDASRPSGSVPASPADSGPSPTNPPRDPADRSSLAPNRHVSPAAYFAPPDDVEQPSPANGAARPGDQEGVPTRQPSNDERVSNDVRERLRQAGVDVEIEALPDLDALILRGNDRDVEEVMRLIQEIERLSVETKPEIEVYPLRHASSESVATLMTEVHKDLIAGLQGRISIKPLVKPNALLFIGWGEAIKSVRELAAKLDRPVAANTQLRVFRLRHAPAATAATTVQEFFAKRTGLGPRVVVTADVRTNAVAVHASPRDIEEVALLIARIDTPRSDAVHQVRVFRLRNTLASDLATVLQGAIDTAKGTAAAQKSAVLELLAVDADRERTIRSGILNEVKVTPDVRANTIVATAPAESMELVEELIRQLDESPTAVAQIKVFRVTNGDARLLVQTLRSALPTQAAGQPALAGAEGESSLAPLRFSVDARTNSIVATGSMGDLKIVEALLLRLDEKGVQQRKNSVYRLKNAPALDVAATVNEFLRSERQVQRAAADQSSPFQQIENEVVVVPEPVSNALVISATPRYFEDIQELVQKLDAEPPQVLIQVLIGEVTLQDADELGAEFGLQDSVLFDRSLLGNLITTVSSSSQSVAGGGTLTTTNEVLRSATLTPGYAFNNAPLGNGASDRSLATSGRVGTQGLTNFSVGRINNELGYGGLVFSAGSESVSVLIRALQESRRLDVLSRPQVTTLDNQPAFIQVGQRVPRIVSTTINEIGQVNSVALENVGLILGVTPRISPDGMVVMEIDAEKSELGPEAEGVPVSISATGEVIRSPRINTTTAQTTVSAANGETIVLGGLIAKSSSSIDRRVPYLSDLPILGGLFRYDSLTTRRSELLIVLTPHVIRNPADAERLKQIEAARMSWCCADLRAVGADADLCRSADCAECEHDTAVVYPDLDPRGAAPAPENPLPEKAADPELFETPDAGDTTSPGRRNAAEPRTVLPRPAPRRDAQDSESTSPQARNPDATWGADGRDFAVSPAEYVRRADTSFLQPESKLIRLPSIQDLPAAQDAVLPTRGVR